MDKPNTIEEITPHPGHYSPRKDMRLNGWLAVATAAYVAELLLLKKNPDWSPALRSLLALAPLLPGFLYVRTWLRFIRGLDELQRRIQLEAFLFAALGTLLVETVVNTLNANGATVGFLSHGLGLGGASWRCSLCGWSGEPSPAAATNEKPNARAAVAEGMVAERTGGEARRLAPDHQCDRDREIRPEPPPGIQDRTALQAAHRGDLQRLGRPATRARGPGVIARAA